MGSGLNFGRSKYPGKTIIHMWLALNKKVLTWELLQRRMTQSPGIFLLCKSTTKENITHMAIKCPFTYKLWG